MLFLYIIVTVVLGLGINWMLEYHGSHSNVDVHIPQINTNRLSSIQRSYRHGAIVTDTSYCSTVGKEIMVMGGSAVDVAIAAMLCVCTFNVHNCGIGGGNIMTIYKRKEQKAYVIMAREMAPGAASRLMFSRQSSQNGGLSIAIPGELKGYWEAHKREGKLPWEQLFIPTIKLCKEGITVRLSLAYNMLKYRHLIDKFDNLRNVLSDPKTGQLYRARDVVRFPKLARTLEIISKEGPDAFYNGSLTRDIVDDITEAGGIITEEDFAKYTAVVRDPVVIDIRDGMRVMSTPPPSGGAVLAFILGILDGYNFDHNDWSEKIRRTKTWHRIVEAFKFAYSKRAEIGDSDVEGKDFSEKLNEVIRNMTSKDYAAGIRSLLSERTHNIEYYEPRFSSVDDAGTSHLSVLTPDGDAVSVTSSVNVIFGSKVVGSRTGILFNDQMDDFSTANTTNFHGLHSSPANFIRPFKRPYSSMCPTVVVDKNGHVRLLVGAAGGSRIPSAVAQVIMGVLWFGLSAKQAVDQRRLHHQLLPNTVDIERGFSEPIITGLQQHGHSVRLNTLAGSIVQIITNKPGEGIMACSDYRKPACPDGI